MSRVSAVLFVILKQVIGSKTSLEEVHPPTWNEPFRPRFHFTTPGGWLGEPTALVFDGYKYHLFAKYSPYTLTPNASHWYHAYSKDLAHWIHVGNVISPRGEDDLRYDFNEWIGEAADGSGVLDIAGVGGCGPLGIVLFWTDREPRSSSPTGVVERQRVGCLYAADDYKELVEITGRDARRLSERVPSETIKDPYTMFLLDNNLEDNPAYMTSTGNTSVAPFESAMRSPKVFSTGNTWHLAFANCDRFTVYTGESLVENYVFEYAWGAKESADDDLTRWHTPICDHSVEGTWGAMGESWEMPELVPLFDETGTVWWIAIVSVACPTDSSKAEDSGPNGGSGTQYFMGQFDGGRFIPVGEQAAGLARWLDHGTDFYGARTISDPDSDVRQTANGVILIAWMNNWRYGASLPTSPWRSAMTLPRKLSLINVNGLSPYLLQRFLGLDKLRTEIHAVKVEEEGSAALIAPESGGFDAMEVNVTWKDVDYSTEGLYLTGTFSGTDGQTLKFGVKAEANSSLTFFVERMPGSFNEDFDSMTTAHASRLVVPYTDISFQVVLDRSSIEVLADNGLISMTLLHFNPKPWLQCSLNGKNIQANWTLLLGPLEQFIDQGGTQAFFSLLYVTGLATYALLL